jgi:hypothetical protein
VATQPVHQQKDFQRPAPHQNDASWKILAEEAAPGKRPGEAHGIISALTKALEEANNVK